MLGFKNFNFAGGQSTRIADAAASKSFGSVVISASSLSGNQITARSIQYIGVRGGVYFYVAAKTNSSVNGGVEFVKYDGSTVTTNISNNSVTVLPYSGGVSASYNSTNTGGQYLSGWHVPSASAPLIELMPGYVTDWATTPTTSSVLNNGTVATATGSTTAAQFHLAMCNSQRAANPSLFRPGWFYKSSGTTIAFRNGTIPSVSNTLTLQAATTNIQTGLTTATGNYISACGFDTSSDTTYGYAVAWVGATDSIYNTKVVAVNSSTVYQATTITFQPEIATIIAANIDTVRDSYAAGTGTDSTYVICTNTSGRTDLQAVTVSNWNSFTSAPTVSLTGTYGFAPKTLARFAATKGKPGSGYIISRLTSTTFEAQEIAVSLAGTITLVGTAYTLTTSVASTTTATSFFSAEVILNGTTEVIAIQYPTASGNQRIGIWKTV